ncbi:sensor domain-containing diguanylate cyclase [Marinobacter halophilus]|uniref:Sensor domain-containing diguanylate cyclase n=1 Tax=Marinobacter halophilus TaxID=1323740 RepID=A0A2T1KIP7_9GAMM|nr:sensor domain-containing diguanylate cyclase [Marinobacter halophilus]
MRFSDFIRAEIEPILQAWEEFAETILPAERMDRSGLRDHAREMLLAIADDLESHQSEEERAAKSKGHGPEGKGPKGKGPSWAEVHGGDRHSSGFSVMETVSEFRALRSSVVSLWSKTHLIVSERQLGDLTRFHEAIDQAVAESLEHYATVKEMETRLFGAILVASPDPIFVLDLEGRFIYANKATADLFGLELEAILGKTAFDLGFSFASDIKPNLVTVIAEQSSFRGKFIHRFNSGIGERFEYLLAPVLDEHHHTEATVCILQDVTERTLAEEKVWHNAHHDLLTGLPNRRLFLDRLDQEIKQAKRGKAPIAVLFMDLDGFKDINDSLGHDAGDRILSEVAERLTDCVREADTVARMGGDEFTVMLTGAQQRKDVEFVARAIINALERPFRIAEQTVGLSASIGVSFYPQDACSPPALLEAADQAMYKAKDSGSDRMCFYDTLYE